MKSGDVMIFKEGQEVHLSELKKGDVVSAMIVTRHPPTMVTERQINATAKAAPKKKAAPAMASSEPSTAAPAAESTPAPAEHKALPKTASPLPIVGLTGLLALALAAGLSAIRRSRVAR
jgi:hypothetical protein